MQQNQYEVVEYYPVSNEDLLVGACNKLLLRWWLSFAPEMPRKTDFDILDHISIAPDIFLIKCLDENSFQFRVHGENANSIFRDEVGRIITTDGPSTTTKEIEELRLAHYYQGIMRNPVCIKNLGNLHCQNRKYTRFESLDCPLLDENKAVTHIIGTISPLF
ncbi:hypothetical protein O4H49_06070 [Kiloniella laminariae]|uniref:PAS domain-containing protein n=1 Tax=Kiloniella laminariae TaxID=454162 RepID=A0ABT4LGW4_9PROT|nr:hypothetical protein [Kiloniella laminariae]MCZ4280333.1 hypothetical protein [Kiloniella laminariae]